MKNISVAIIDKNPTTNELLKQFIEDNKKVTSIKQFLDLKEGYDFISKEKTNIVFIDTEFGEEIVLSVAGKIYQNNNDAKIILIGKHFSVTSVIKAMKSGIKETLLKPVLQKDLDIFLTKYINQSLYENTEINSKIITIFSSKGGIGKTTIATNLANEIANITKEKTIIVDFNSQFGDVCSFLNSNSEFGISYLLDNRDKINKEFLLQNLARYSKSGLYILGDMFYYNEEQKIDLKDIQTIIDALKSTFSYIIIDMGCNLDFKSTLIFDNSDTVIMPIVANMPNLRNCQRCLNFLSKMGYKNEKIKLILNRYMKKDEIKSENIEQILNKKIFAKISNNYFVNMTAINRGISVSDADINSDIAKDIQNLAYLMSKDGE